MRPLRNETLYPYAAPMLRRLALLRPIGGNWKMIALRLGLVLGAHLLFAGLNLGHGVVRGVALDVAPFEPVNAAQWDIAVYGGVPSAWMQDLLGTSGFWARVGFYYWATLFWVPALLIAIVVMTRGNAYVLRLMALHMVLVLSADVIYGIVPSRPPWMDVDLVRIIGEQSNNGVHIDRNPFAALPSLHVAVPLVCALWFRGFPKSDPLRRLSPVLFAWALGMGWCVIYTGEHYVIDVVTGYAWALLAYGALNRLGVLHAPLSNLQPAPDVVAEMAGEPAHDRKRLPAPSTEQAA